MFNSDSEKLAFKHTLKAVCIDLLEQRIAVARTAMQQAQESANQEDKSSAGDKYETARAMGHLDRDMNARQMKEALEEMKLLKTIPDGLCSMVVPGAVVMLGGELFYMAVGLGAIRVNDIPVMVPSTRSPLFSQLKQKKAGDKVMFRQKETVISLLF